MIYFKKIAYPGKYQDDSAIPQLLGYIMRQDRHHIVSLAP